MPFILTECEWMKEEIMKNVYLYFVHWDSKKNFAVNANGEKFPPNNSIHFFKEEEEEEEEPLYNMTVYYNLQW